MPDRDAIAALRALLQVLIYPAVDHDFNRPSARENAEGYLLSRNDMIWFWNNYLRRPEDAGQSYAVPMRAEVCTAFRRADHHRGIRPVSPRRAAYAQRLRRRACPSR